MGTLSPNLWYSALASEIGVIVKTSDPALAREQLEKIKVELNDPNIECISIHDSPADPFDLWLVKRKPTNNAAEGSVSPPKGNAKSSER